MSLNKAIKSGKEHRKPYRKAKGVIRHCRNHGACLHCLSNRIIKNIKRELSAKSMFEDMEDIQGEH